MAPLMMANSIEQCQDIGGYVFEDPHILWEALQMAGSGVFTIGDRSVPDGNKRLAVLGDQALDIISCKKWYEGGQQKRTWDKLRKSSTSNENLSKLGEVHGIDACINRNPSNPHISATMRATTVEAIIGAAYLDGGPTAAARVMVSFGLLEAETK